MTIPLNIAVIGTGYVGLVTAVCLSNLGFTVHCIDKNPLIIEKLKKKEVPFYEPGLQALLKKNMDQGRFYISTEISSVQNADLIFIAVGTPSEDNGQADLSYLHDAIQELAPFVQEGAVVVIKSTVPMGTNRFVQDNLQKFSEKNIHVVSNPEFLREGAALNDFMHPDRIIIGTTDPHAKALMQRLYQVFENQQVPFLFVSWETAELIKYAANSFLAMKVGFTNELANLCECANADIMEVAAGMGLDHRIGRDFLNPGPGYGGSCFPKDTLALAYTAATYGVELTLLKTLIQSNNTRKKEIYEKIVEACGGSLQGKTLAILGITFKAETDDIRESPSLTILPLLQQAGAELQVYDPQGMERGKEFFQNARWCSSPLEATQQADGLVILTEWNVFRHMDLKKISDCMRTPLLIDLRNLYKPCEIPTSLTYISLGRGVKPSSQLAKETIKVEVNDEIKRCI